MHMMLYEMIHCNSLPPPHISLPPPPPFFLSLLLFLFFSLLFFLFSLCVSLLSFSFFFFLPLSLSLFLPLSLFSFFLQKQLSTEERDAILLLPLWALQSKLQSGELKAVDVVGAYQSKVRHKLLDLFGCS